MTKYRKLALFACASIAVLGACSPYMREETAMRLASPAWMVERIIPSTPFGLTAYERMHERVAPANIYIEGEGTADTDFKPLLSDPTPRNPVALHLATRDNAKNVVYLARPFQLRFDLDKDQMISDYWQNKRFSPEVIASYNSALDEIKRRYDITGFNLIGYDGGANIAALVAASRDDVLSLRTVAGNLDSVVYTNTHEMPPLDGSLNAVTVAPKLRDLPQNHYIGGQDKIIRPAVLHSYLQAMGPSNCVKSDLIQEASHTESWVDKWPGLLADQPTCRGPVVAPEFTYEEAPEPIYSPREVPEKP